MKVLFLDTSYLLALELANDKNHAEAQNHWQSYLQNMADLVTTSYVFDEVVTYFNSRGYHDKALKIGHILLTSEHIKIVHVDETLFFAAWEYFQQKDDKDYSLTDCISFLVMKFRKINQALTFDHHFLQAGFQKLP